MHFVQYWPPPPAPAPAHLCSGLCHQLVGRTASNFDQLQSALMINSHNFLLSPTPPPLSHGLTRNKKNKDGAALLAGEEAALD